MAISAIHRFEGLSAAVDAICETFCVSRQRATHIVWDFDTKIGSDRAIWLDFDRIRKVI